MISTNTKKADKNGNAPYFFNHDFEKIFNMESNTSVPMYGLYANETVGEINITVQDIGISINISSDLETETNLYSEKNNFRDRYEQIAKSKWFKETYENKSIGDVIGLEL